MRTQAIPTTLAALALVAVLGGAGCTPQTTPQTDGRGTDAEEQAG